MRKRWRERNGLYFSLFLRNGCGMFDGGESGGAVEPLTGRKRDAAHGRHGLPDRLARRSLTLAGIGADGCAARSMVANPAAKVLPATVESKRRGKVCQ